MCIVVFFLMIPWVGALHVRQRWRGLRKQLLASLSVPRLRYHDQSTAAHFVSGNCVGCRRMIGVIDAVEGDSTLWISNGEVSAAVEMTGQHLVVLSGMQEDLMYESSAEVGKTPVVIPWDRMFTISQGTQVYLFGRVVAENGRLVFTPESNRSLLIVLFEGAPELLLYRAVWNARQRNEFYNQMTPGSLTLGSAVLLLLAFLLLGNPDARLWGLIALTMSFTPLLPLVPPGVGAYYGFRRLWQSARVMRSRRDLIKAAEVISAASECTRLSAQAADEKGRQGIPRVWSGLSESEVLYASPQQQDCSDILQRPLLLPVNPQQIMIRLNTRAHLFEGAAVLLFCVGQVVNTYLLFVLLSYAV